MKFVYYWFTLVLDASTPKASETVIILKLRNILDDEKEKRITLERHISRLESRTNSSFSNEDSLR